MTAPLDIGDISTFQQVKLDDLELVFQKEKQIPGAWNYQIRRYKRHSFWTNDDFGVFHYHFQPVNSAENYMELKFCIIGNAYCEEKFTECDHCKLQASKHCDHKIPTVDCLEFRFDPANIAQFAKGMKTISLTEDVLNFRHRTSFARPIQLHAKIRTTLESLLNHSYSDVLENIFINAQTQILLLYSIETMLGTKSEELPIRCKFLHNEADRDKISRAREILIEHIGDPITIKELSRKVAINECYLKKGFKEMFGTTIFDFYQNQRMEHARFLLYEKGLSVSEVSALLGYSSISHFSTAFKKHTGLKPCELLIRN
ncbi:MAG: helix-turn-helix transcriptional regulator [Sphingobacteriales bacterium]|jgi:AraC family transcriptional regulator